jgi:hypothetical protein
MNILQAKACRKELITRNLLAGNRGYPSPERLKLRKLPTTCISLESFTLALDRNDG